MKKIYVKGNYLVIDYPNGTKLMSPCPNIKMGRVSNSDEFYYRTIDKTRWLDFTWTEFEKEDGSAFSSIEEFETFVTENTGNFKSGSGQNPDPQASENIPKVISLSLSDIGATSWDDDIKTLLAQHINSLGLDIKGAELYFFEVEGDDGKPSSSDVVTDVSISMTTNSELSLSTTGANGQTEITIIPLNPLEENNW